jgi:hypothetical protein
MQLCETQGTFSLIGQAEKPLCDVDLPKPKSPTNIVSIVGICLAGQGWRVREGDVREDEFAAGLSGTNLRILCVVLRLRGVPFGEGGEGAEDEHVRRDTIANFP